MPDSIREVLQGIADDEPEPSRDLAAGAYRRARSIGRRRFATVAVAALTGLAMASAAAAIVDRDRLDEQPPVDDPTVTDPATVPDDDEVTPTGEESENDETCGVPDDWTGWGPSDSMGDMSSLPDAFVFEVRSDGASSDPTIVRFEGDEPSTVLQDGEYFVAPDGSRFAVGSADECTGTLASLIGDKIDGLPVFTAQCAPSWSPDSDRVVLNLADAESTGAYLLDVATGETSFEVPEEVGCSPRWSADGEYLASSDGAVAMRPDGSGRVELAGADSWNSESGFTGLSSISADLSRACLQFDDETAASGHVDANRCDRYVDTATGEELELPVDAEAPNVVFLADGSMIVCDDQYGQIVLTLVGADGETLDSKTLPGQSSGGTFLRGYFVEP